MRSIFTLALSVLVLANSWGQSVAHPKGCGYDHYVQWLDQEYPGFRTALDQPFERVANNVQTRDLELYTIPVVVHIVYQNEDQNLSNEQIQDVIDVLNEDYRRLNTDADLVRAEFSDVVGDPFIQFELMGVERVETEATFELDILAGSLPDNVKQVSEGGSEAWDTEQYLNIWVCNIEGGSLLGYAYPPADLAHWPEGANAPSPELDGVVIHFDVFRRSGTYTTTGLIGNEEITVPIRGRSITHEVGHYLGLRHIWGDGLLSIIGIADCDADDGVADTPNQGLSSQFACDPMQNTCTDEADDKPDMYENFMDYAAEDCLNSFTMGQIAIMRSVLENERSGLLGGPVNTSSPDLQAAILKVFPNPVRHELVFQLNAWNAEEADVRLIDLQGRVVQRWQKSMQTEGVQLQLQPQAAGIYLLQVQSADQVTGRRIVIH